MKKVNREILISQKIVVGRKKKLLIIFHEFIKQSYSKLN